MASAAPPTGPLRGSNPPAVLPKHFEAYVPEAIHEPCLDVCSSQFFSEFMADPQARNAELKIEQERTKKTLSREQLNATLWGERHHSLRKFRRHDFRLNAREQAVFREHGFVVSERMGAESFAEAYYRIYTDDLPVFVSADSVLHAWHRSFDAMLNELEEQVLACAIGETLRKMTRAVQQISGERGVESNLVSTDVFLTVAATLLDGEKVPTVLGEQTDARVSVIMRAIKAESRVIVNVFGAPVETDFSMLKPRGRYTRTTGLQRYFQCVSWLGQIGIRVGGQGSRDDHEQLACALTLLELAHRGGVMNVLMMFDDLVRRFIGETDCAGLSDLARVCCEAGVQLDALCPTSSEQVEGIYNKLMESRVGVQQYGGDIYYENELVEGRLPRSICMMGRRFILDSWMMTTLVNNGKNDLTRRVPSALDVAFGALGNNAALPHIVRRMASSRGCETAEPFVPFRDGIDYGLALVESRRCVDALEPEQWASSIYMLWMASLRAFSAPHPWASSDDCLGSPAWQAREMNTQLASWTQLRHDTVLYAKQGFTCSTCCEYPAGLVEPRPDFWGQMENMSLVTAALLRDVPAEVDGLTPSQVEEKADDHFWFERRRTPTQLLAHMANFLDCFSKTMGKLRDIAELQLERRRLTDEQENFLKCVMEERFGSGGSRYLGWYPKLFYTSREDSGKREVLVTDVHTDPADPNVGDPGSVLHEGIGNVHMMFVVADTSAPGEESSSGGGSPCCYAGPVFSHYEFLSPSGTRLTDQDWQAVLDKGSVAGIRVPVHPVWTQPWLVDNSGETEALPSSHRRG